MSRDPLDELSSRLFAAVREEPAPPGAEQRALEAARRVVSTPRTAGARPRLLLLAATLAGLALILLALSQQERPKVEIAAERASSNNRAVQRPPATAALPAPSPTALTSSIAKALPSVALPARSVPVTLADELDALKLAQQALAASDTQAALKALDRYDRVLKGQKLRAEATLLRIEALSKSGQGEAAAELATRFARQNPTSPLVDRARSFIKPGMGGLEHD